MAGERLESACSATLPPRRGAVAPARLGPLQTGAAQGRGQERDEPGSRSYPLRFFLGFHDFGAGKGEGTNGHRLGRRRLAGLGESRTSLPEGPGQARSASGAGWGKLGGRSRVSSELEHAAEKFFKNCFRNQRRLLWVSFLLTSKEKHVWDDGGSRRVGDTVCYIQDRAEDTEVVLGEAERECFS